MNTKMYNQKMKAKWLVYTSFGSAIASIKLLPYQSHAVYFLLRLAGFTCDCSSAKTAINLWTHVACSWTILKAILELTSTGNSSKQSSSLLDHHFFPKVSSLWRRCPSDLSIMLSSHWLTSISCPFSLSL